MLNLEHLEKFGLSTEELVEAYEKDSVQVIHS